MPSPRYTAIAGQGGLGMASDYYLLEGEKYDGIRKAYRAYIQKMLELGGIADASAKADAIFALETSLAEVHWTPAQSRDIAKLNDPQTVAGLISTLALGALADRIAPKLGVAISMALLCLALVSIPFVEPGILSIGYGFVLGCAAGSIRAVEAAAYAHYFGTAHIGGIRGVATMINVGSTAFGPVALSIGHDIAGSYVPVVVGLALVPFLVGVLACLTPTPRLPSDRPVSGISTSI